MNVTQPHGWHISEPLLSIIIISAHHRLPVPRLLLGLIHSVPTVPRNSKILNDRELAFRIGPLRTQKSPPRPRASQPSGQGKGLRRVWAGSRSPFWGGQYPIRICYVNLVSPTRPALPAPIINPSNNHVASIKT